MAALQDRRKRWKCPECSTVNRAWRDECFGEGCEVKYEAAMASKRRKTQHHAADDGVVVDFKDENSKVIARIPSKVAALIKSDLQYVVSRLVKSEEYSKNKHENLSKTDALQRQMRTGQQVLTDFEDSGALWGYARRKFSSRAVVSYELFCSARATLLASSSERGSDVASVLDSNPTVVSIGGGPGNDMFGFLLYQRYGLVADTHTVVVKDTAPVSEPSPPPRLHVYDFARNWSPIVARVAELSGHTIQFQTCNLKEPLLVKPTDSSENGPLHNFLQATRTHTSPTVFLFCYVISEVMGSSGDPPPLLEDLFKHYNVHGNGALFLFREPHTHALQTLLSRHGEWREGYDFWHLSHGGLMVWVSP